MGSGVAQVVAQTGYPTTVIEPDEKILKKGMDRINSRLEKGKAKGRLTDEQVESVLRNLSPSTRLREVEDCDVIIEAVTENTELKIELFGELSAIAKDGAILATNTSSISITKIASATKRPEYVVGMHFFNPVTVMKLVEIVKGLSTSDAVVEAAKEFVVSLGKEPITCPDMPAFVVNKLLTPYLLDAARMVQDGIATPEDVDKAMVLGCGYPMGPITLIDYIGIDTICHVADVMFNEFKEPKYAAPILLRRMVAAGHLGRKTGRGFYHYDA
jgi:3-hydroxybutyryl-CoA dehydrogenase